jgi:fructokinase
MFQNALFAAAGPPPGEPAGPTRHAIGIDLGGTKIEAITLDPAGAECWRRRVPSPAHDYAALLDAIAGLVAEARARLPAGATPPSIGIGGPGSPAADGRIKNANTTCLNGRTLAIDLSATLGLPVHVANDANCLALSEATDGAGAGAAVVFAAILGTGTGAGIAVHGRVLQGPNGLAGEWGHNPLPWSRSGEPRPPCYCGQAGCIESLLSGPALAQDHARRHGGGLTARDIAAAADAGDAAAADTLDRWLDRLARALAGVINLLDPDVIVLGGGLSRIGRIYDELPQRCRPWIFSAGTDEPLHTRVLPALHGDSSGVRGAAWLGRSLQPKGSSIGAGTLPG